MARNARSSRRGRRPAAWLPASCLIVDPASDGIDAALPAGPALSGAADPTGPVPAVAPRPDGAPASAPVPLAAPRTLQGRIEKIGRSGVVGWVWDPYAPGERIRLELAERQTRLAEVVADNDRPDLVPLGCGDGRHGFSLALDDARLPEGRHVLTLRCAATGAEMPGSPITLECRAAATAASAVGLPAPASGSPARAPPPVFHAYIDDVSDSRIEGWITRTDRPSHRCTVLLKEVDRVIARTVASRFRADLLAAGLGDGCHAFVFEPPGALFDGKLHLLHVVEEETGTVLTREPLRWSSRTGRTISTRPRGTDMLEHRSPVSEAIPHGDPPVVAAPVWSDASHRADFPAAGYTGTRILFDMSDLVYYLGHHPNLTGIQRVQSSIVLAMIDGELCPPAALVFLSFNVISQDWVVIPTGFFISLLRDLFLPERQRRVGFPAEAARYGVLPGALAFDGTGVLDDGNPSVLCLLGAAWVHQDYLHRVLALKRHFGTRFVMTVHDLIPIYARETCDQDTAQAFEQFMRRALRHVDHILAVSDHTAKDVRRYLAALQYPEPPITVTQNGSSFAEFLPPVPLARPPRPGGRQSALPARFVLFVATIEGRKNHPLMLEIWRRLVQEEADPPHLICIGRLGWKASAFVSAVVETNYLEGRIHLLREISDTDLRLLYGKCLFAVLPSFYEGWGLTVGETLAMGKICVISDRSSIPEVAGDCGVYIDIDSVERSLAVIRDLIRDGKARKRLEAKIRRDYVPITWRSVAQKVVTACAVSVAQEWPEPYPCAALPYATEISFGRLDNDADGTGEALLARIVDARLGHFTFDLLTQQNFLLGEEVRSDGSWAQPEHWGTWLCHAGGDIEFSLAAEPSRTCYVFLSIRVSGEMHDQAIRLIVNGEWLWKGAIGHESKDVVLRVRKPADIRDRWRLRIRAEVDLPPELHDRIAAADGRVPTIGFERLIVVPENDTKTRLDVLSNLLL